MSRCYCCNVILTPFELTSRTLTGNYLEMCTKCYKFVEDDIKIITRQDLEEETGIHLADYIDNIDYVDNVDNVDNIDSKYFE